MAEDISGAVGERPISAWQEEGRQLGTEFSVLIHKREFPVQLEAISASLMQVTTLGGGEVAEDDEVQPVIDALWQAIQGVPFRHSLEALSWVLHNMAVWFEARQFGGEEAIDG